MIHIDDFIDGPMSSDDGVKYARWFFVLYRFPAILKMQFSRWMSKYQLFCDFEGKRWRVTGCSRMGDVWLSEDFARDCGYTKRVNVDDCSNWREVP